MDIRTRFWSKVNKTEDCWLWTAATDPFGYGHITIGGRQFLAHRYSYELANGSIPPGLHLDHLCRVPRCVNPSHLEPVTCQVNLLRSPISLAAINAAKTHCKRGHAFIVEPVFLSGKRRRVCQECIRIDSKNYYYNVKKVAPIG